MKNFFKNKTKYVVFDIILFLLSSISAILIGLLEFIDIINLGTEKVLSIVLVIIGILSISNLLERYGILEVFQKLLIELNEKEKGKINLSSRIEIEDLPKYALQNRFNNAEEILIMNHSNLTLLNQQNIMYIEEALIKGTRFKFISNIPNCESAKESLKYKKADFINDPIEQGIELYKYLVSNKEYFKNNTEYKLTEINLPCSLMIIKKNDGKYFIKVDLYSVKIPERHRRSFIINSDDVENINFYLNQWNTIWENHSIDYK